MDLSMRTCVATMLLFAMVMREGAAKEILYNVEEGNEGAENDESEQLSFSPLPLCAQEMLLVRLGDDDDENMEYSPSSYTEVRCKKNGGTGLTEQRCSFPISSRRFSASNRWGSTTCLQRWDTVTVFRRPTGTNGKWQKYDERVVRSGCECVIMTPQMEEDDPSVESRMVPVALQHYSKGANRYDRSIEITV